MNFQLYPYILRKVQALVEADNQSRLEMCQFLVNQPREWYDNLVMTDERCEHIKST